MKKLFIVEARLKSGRLYAWPVFAHSATEARRMLDNPLLNRQANEDLSNVHQLARVREATEEERQEIGPPTPQDELPPEHE
jgi:hypothetical protein